MNFRLSIFLLAVLAFGLSARAQTTVSNTTYGSGQNVTVLGPSTVATSGTVSVTNGANVKFFATTQITLNAGFSSSGATFEASAVTLPETLPTVTVTPSTTSVQAGQSISFTVAGSNSIGISEIGLESCAASGGVTANLGNLSVSGTSASHGFAWTAPDAGTYYFDGYAWNASHTAATRTAVIAITVPGVVPTVTVTPSTTSVQTGQSISFTVAGSSSNGMSEIGLESCNSSGGLIANLGYTSVNGTSASQGYAWTAPDAGTYYFDGYAWNASHTAATRTAVIAITVLPGRVLPYLTDFEASDGYSLGSLDHQLGWSIAQGTASVTNLDASHGTQSVVLAPGSTLAQAAQTFAPLSGASIIFVDFYAKPVAETDINTATTFDVGSARFAFVLNGSQGTLQAFNGNGSGGGAWQSTPFIAPLLADYQSQNWIRLTARLDYTHQTWDLYANGIMVAADLNFRDSTSTYLSSFAVTGDAATATGLDDIFAGPQNPLFADVNNDGIDDAWETAHGLSLSIDQRNLDPDGDGVTNLQEYLQGTDPQKQDALSVGFALFSPVR